jgi:hypothetical protein
MLNDFRADYGIESVVEIFAGAERTQVLNIKRQTWVWVPSLTAPKFSLRITERDHRVPETRNISGNRTIATSCIENKGILDR